MQVFWCGPAISDGKPHDKRKIGTINVKLNTGFAKSLQELLTILQVLRIINMKEPPTRKSVARSLRTKGGLFIRKEITNEALKASAILL